MNRMRLIGILLCVLFCLPTYAVKQKKKQHYEPLFGKSLASYQVTSSTLKGATFYLVSGHGGPDPGCIGKYQGKELHEDEYAYDIILRLGRELLKRGAKVHFIIQDAKDGIRNTAILKNSKRETCMGKAIPLGQVARLQQRCDAINRLYRKDKSKYKRAIFIHVIAGAVESRLMFIFTMLPEVNMVNGLLLSCKRLSRQNMTAISLIGDLTVR